jgi:hypothetical protein
VAGAALLVAVFTWYIGHTRSKKSDQIRISREIWDHIDAEEKIIESWSQNDPSRSNLDMINALDSLVNELGLFVNFTKWGEIKDSTIRNYYRGRLLRIFKTAKFINKLTTKEHPEGKDYSGAEDLLRLIEDYHKVIGKTEAYRKEFV